MKGADEEKGATAEVLAKKLNSSRNFLTDIKSGIHVLRNRISLRNLKFLDKNLEEKYDKEQAAKLVWLWRALSVVGFIAFTGYYTWSLLTKPFTFAESCRPNAPQVYPYECRVYRKTWDIVMYLATCFLPLFLGFLLTFCKNIFRKHYRILSSFLILLIGILNLCLDELGNGPLEPTRIALPIIVFILATHFFLRVNFINAVFNSFMIFIAFASFQVAQLDQKPANEVIFSIIYMITTTFLVCLIALNQELIQRIQFYDNFKVSLMNEQHMNQLYHLQKSFLKNTIDSLRSPLEKATNLVKFLLVEMSPSSAQYTLMENLLELMTSPNIMIPNIEEDLRRGVLEIDTYTEEWVLNTLLKRNDVDFVQDKEASMNNQGIISVDPNLACLQIAEYIHLADPMQAKQQMEGVVSWNFSIFEFAAVTNNRPLIGLSFCLFSSMGFFDKFQIPFEKFFNFMKVIESGYHKSNPYHNQNHAADVLQATFYLCSLPKITAALTDLEKLALFVAAIVHDFDHPGFNNRFLINSKANKALLYNDRSVLENHHVAAAFLHMEDAENNFLAHLSQNDFQVFRKIVVDAVLATDLNLHFTFMTDIRRALAEQKSILIDETIKTLLFKVILKSADISNPTRPLELAKQWANLFLEESFFQGDEEKKRKLSISPFCDRSNSKIGHCQVSFIDLLCKPLYSVLNDIDNISDICLQLEKNREYWDSIKQQEQ